MPSTISCSSQDRSSAAGVSGRITRASSSVIAVIAREIVDAGHPVVFRQFWHVISSHSSEKWPVVLFATPTGIGTGKPIN